MKIHISVRSRTGVHHFGAIAYAHASPEQFHMDPVDFYKKWGGSIPPIPHFELEIVEPERAVLEKQVLHTHKSRFGDMLFVCYPLHIPTMERAWEVFQTWCIGTVGTIVENVDLNTIYSQECENDKEKFLKVMHERFGIYLIGGSI